jgi:hypothetical protein
MSCRALFSCPMSIFTRFTVLKGDVSIELSCAVCSFSDFHGSLRNPCLK